MDGSVKRDIRLINTAGVMGSVYARLAFGEILLFFITQCLNIPKETWALVAGVIPLTAVFHVVSAYLTEHLQRRKLLSLGCFAVARLAVPAISLLPFVTGDSSHNIRLYCLAAALIAHSSISALGASSWLSWVADIVPKEHRGQFWSLRLALSTAANIVVLLGAGWLIDYFTPGNRWGYVVIFGFAFLIGELDLLIHTRVADRPMPERKEELRLLPLLAAPWRHRGFRNLMLYRLMFVFGSSLVGPFAFMYLIEELKLTATEVCTLTATFMVCQGLSFRVWRKIGDRVGYRTICMVGGTMSGFGILYWWFLRQDNFAVLFALLILARMYFGFVDAGIMLAHTTLTMNTAPDKHRSMYFAQVTVIVSMAMALGILCGRWIFIHANPTSDVYLFGTKLTAVHVLIGLFGISRFVAIRVSYRRIPDAKAEAAMPRIARILRTRPLRIFPTLLSVERPISDTQRAEHVDSMKQLIPAPREVRLEDALATVLKDRIDAEEEFLRIIGKIRATRAKGIEQMTGEIAESAAVHCTPARAKGAAARIKRLFAEGDLAGCLRTVRRLAHQTADEWHSPMADSALSVIDALARSLGEGPHPREETVLLAIYALLQIVREPEDQHGPGGRAADH